MSDAMEMRLNCCTGMGAAAGFGTGIWAAINILQPGLADTDGISEAGATWLTIGICLLIGLKAATAAGACAGLATGVATEACIIPPAKYLGNGCSSFFNSRSAASTASTPSNESADVEDINNSSQSEELQTMSAS